MGAGRAPQRRRLPGRLGGVPGTPGERRTRTRAARAPAGPELPPYEALNAAGPWWDGGPLPPPAALTAAIESVLLEHGLTDGAEIARRVAQAERAGSETPPAARLVAHAWRDAAFRARLLADATAAAAELGIAPSQRTLVLEDTPRAHHVLVCTLCSCFPLLVGRKPTWYKSPAYRARVVLEPRAVLREFGLDLDDETAVRVQDTCAEERYFVLPVRPGGTERYSEDQLADLVTPEVLLGVAVPQPARGLRARVAGAGAGRRTAKASPATAKVFEATARSKNGSQLGEEQASDPARRIDPEVRVVRPGPGPAVGAPAGRRRLGVDEAAEPPLLDHAGEELDVVPGVRHDRPQHPDGQPADLVPRHLGDGLGVQEARAVQLAAAQQHAQEAQIVRPGGVQAGAAVGRPRFRERCLDRSQGAVGQALVR